MATYSQRVRDSILPLSVGGTLPEAFEEWSFSGETIDHEAPSETCELCGQQDLRYHFKISNQFTRHELWVGSHCILQFEVPVLEHGRRLSADEARRLLNKLTQQMQLQSCVSALKRLAQKEQHPILLGALDYYQRKKKLTPKYAAVVFWKLRQHGIDHHPSFFGIELKRHKHIDDLRSMPTGRVHQFWAALTPAQRKKAVELGHPEPG